MQIGDDIRSADLPQAGLLFIRIVDDAEIPGIEQIVGGLEIVSVAPEAGLICYAAHIVHQIRADAGHRLFTGVAHLYAHGDIVELSGLVMVAVELIVELIYDLNIADAVTSAGFIELLQRLDEMHAHAVGTELPLNYELRRRFCKQAGMTAHC